MAFNQ